MTFVSGHGSSEIVMVFVLQAEPGGEANDPPLDEEPSDDVVCRRDDDL